MGRFGPGRDLASGPLNGSALHLKKFSLGGPSFSRPALRDFRNSREAPGFF
jgi:hypothetical protein